MELAMLAAASGMRVAPATNCLRAGGIQCSAAVATSGVQSWFDQGTRLAGTGIVAPVTAASEEDWPLLGGSGAWHPMRGPWPKAPVREQWTPPPDWKPPKKAVVVISWYDSGKRLVGSWYDAGIRITAPAAETASALDELWADAVYEAAPPAGFEWGGTY